jgi:hypothetical protein
VKVKLDENLGTAGAELLTACRIIDVSSTCSADMSTRINMLPSSARFDPAKPCNALPQLPPAAEVESRHSRIGNVVDAGLAQRQTASEYLKDLCAIGVLREVTAGREKLFLHPKLLTLLASDEHTFEASESR